MFYTETADTGYLVSFNPSTELFIYYSNTFCLYSQQRKLCKLMENFKVAYDETVRDATGNIIQFQYGDDGYDGVNIVRLKIPERLEPLNCYEYGYEDEMAIIREIDNLEKSQQYLEWWHSVHKEELVPCPVDVEALYERAKILSEKQRMKPLLNKIWKRCWEFICGIKNELFQHYLVMFLQMQRVLQLSDMFFDWFLKQIQDTYDRCFVAPGEMVGVLAGQSKCLFGFNYSICSFVGFDQPFLFFGFDFGSFTDICLFHRYQ